MRSKNKSAAAPLSEFVKRMSPECRKDMPLSASMMAHICLLNSVLERAGDRRAAEHGLTMAQWLALGCAGNAGDVGITHSELGQRLMLSKAPITGVVDRLERGGYVTRVPDERDRRVSRVKITPRGMETWQSVRVSLHEFAHQVCEGLSEEQMLQTHDLLVHLLENTARIDPTLAGDKSGGSE
jgi:MarR family transcriptional regulator, 2-MHQ and catechol-resistance regulon repressor